jgi:hypothetical protein
VDRVGPIPGLNVAQFRCVSLLLRVEATAARAGKRLYGLALAWPLWGVLAAGILSSLLWVRGPDLFGGHRWELLSCLIAAPERHRPDSSEYMAVRLHLSGPHQRRTRGHLGPDYIVPVRFCARRSPYRVERTAAGPSCVLGVGNTPLDWTTVINGPCSGRYTRISETGPRGLVRHCPTTPLYDHLSESAPKQRDIFAELPTKHRLLQTGLTAGVQRLQIPEVRPEKRRLYPTLYAAFRSLAHLEECDLDGAIALHIVRVCGIWHRKLATFQVSPLQDPSFCPIGNRNDSVRRGWIRRDKSVQCRQIGSQYNAIRSRTIYKKLANVRAPSRRNSYHEQCERGGDLTAHGEYDTNRQQHSARHVLSRAFHLMISDVAELSCVDDSEKKRFRKVDRSDPPLSANPTLRPQPYFASRRPQCANMSVHCGHLEHHCRDGGSDSNWSFVAPGTTPQICTPRFGYPQGIRVSWGIAPTITHVARHRASGCHIGLERHRRRMRPEESHLI